MKKYNIKNYIRYKEDLKKSMPEVKQYNEYTRNELIVKFTPLVESLARKFSTSQQASGVLTILDLIQIGSEALIKAVDKLDWVNKLSESEDIEKTLKSFFTKRIKGAIRRRIDINRGDIKIPEYVLNEMRRNNSKNEKIVQMFFNAVFSSIDENNDNSYYDQIEDKSQDYNKELFSLYLDSLIKKHLNDKEYYVIKNSFGIGCDKIPAKQIAANLDINVDTAQIRVSQIKRDAINKLITNVDHSQVIDYL